MKKTYTKNYSIRDRINTFYTVILDENDKKTKKRYFYCLRKYGLNQATVYYNLPVQTRDRIFDIAKYKSHFK